ncbi:MAG: hypothetical protein ACLFST_04690 [Spirochaetia bacterium]
MFLSDKFIAKTEKIIKKNREKPVDQQIALIRDSFFSAASAVPEECRHRLFNSLVEQYHDEKQELTFLIRALGDVIDLFRSEYDTENDPLPEETWGVIRECVRRCAADMDMTVVSYIMKLMVSTHRI